MGEAVNLSTDVKRPVALYSGGTLTVRRARPAGQSEAAAPRVTDVPVLLQLCVHTLIAALLAMTMVRAFTSPVSRPGLTVAAAIVLGCVYAVGPAWPVVRRSTGAAGAWLGAVLVIWLALLSLSPDAIWLAFPWFFLLLHLLPWRIGLPAVGLVTAAAIGGFAWHQGSINVGTAIGPILGALVAVATVWGYSTIAQESERRRELIAELHRTQSDLASAERAAGAAAERERLAREIHDTLAQGLSSIQLLLRAADRALAGISVMGSEDASALTEARRRIELARETASDNLSEARRFVAELAPPGLQGHSLPSVLDRLCRTTSERSGLPVRFEVQGPADGADAGLPTPVEVALLRIAQSALANVAAHAQASRAAVTLTHMDHAVALDIVDDGTGFDVSAVEGGRGDGGRGDGGRGEGGFGLVAMRSRVAELGGTLTIESSPGDGTAVAVTFPVGATDHG